MQKSFEFTERVNLQFRSEFFNILNHIATPGQLTSSYSPRQIQFALKLLF